jgi:hypothetical protein
MATESFLKVLQNIATAAQRVEDIAEAIKEVRVSATARLERLEGQLADLRERVARLETSRNADSAQIQADMARFKAEFERVEAAFARRASRKRLSPPLD